MASLIQELQDLLAAERGQVEAVHLFEEEIEDMDPDIADGLRDVEESSTWACQGLYHRITQLGDAPTLLMNDLPTRLLEKPELEDRLRVLCSEQPKILYRINGILKRDDFDEATKQFLDEDKRLHKQAREWCSRVLSQWKREAYLPPSV